MASKLCQALKLNGIVHIQVKQDPRDGLYKLIEVNLAISNHFWIGMALGIDAPLLAMKVAKGERFDTVQQDNSQMVFITPVQDMAAFGVYLLELLASKVLRSTPVDPENPPPPRLAEVVASYKETYTVARKVYDPYFADFLRDPLVSILWWAAFGALNLQHKRQGVQ
jgi:hypothetical protein